MGDRKHCAQTNMQPRGNIIVGTTAIDLRPDKSILSVEFYIESNSFNSGYIYIGTSTVKNDGTKHLIKLEPGDSTSITYSDVENALYAISNVDNQTIIVGILTAKS